MNENTTNYKAKIIELINEVENKKALKFTYFFAESKYREEFAGKNE